MIDRKINTNNINAEATGILLFAVDAENIDVTGMIIICI